MDVNTRMLRYFVAVAEELHVTRTAQRLYISQPALSKQLARLEAQLDVTLLDRSGPRLRLTPAGEALLPLARDTLAAWDTAQRRVRAADRAGQPQLVVGFIASAANEHTPAILARFKQLRPGCNVQLLQSDWEDPTAGLANGTTDAAFLRAPIPPDPAINVQTIISEPLILALPADHPLTAHDQLSLDQVLDEPFIATRGPAAWRDWWLATSQRNGRTPRIATTVGSPDEWVHAIASGQGMSLAPAASTRFYAQPGIAYRPITGPPPSLVAIAHRHDTRNPAIDDFVRACLEITCTTTSHGHPVEDLVDPDSSNDPPESA